MNLSSILGPLEYAVSWILVTFHSLFTTLGMPSDGGLTWMLSIIGLVVVIRTLLIPLFVKQIKAQRGMQMLQPQIKALQEKYKNDREKLAQEQMKLWRESGTNPLSSCLPLLLQMPIFFALFRVLDGIARNYQRGIFADRPGLMEEAAEATIFGAPIAATLYRAERDVAGVAGAEVVSVYIIAGILIVLMTSSMFIMQKQLMTKNMPAAALEGPFAQQQKIMLYLFPVIFLFSGFSFPIGVLLYWTTSNLWTMAQQLFVIARMPAPGSIAEERYNAKKAEKEKRRAAKRKGGGGGATAVDAATAEEPPAEQPAPRTGQRQQPKRQPRSRRAPAKGSSPGAAPGSPPPAPRRPDSQTKPGAAGS